MQVENQETSMSESWCVLMGYQEQKPDCCGWRNSAKCRHGVTECGLTGEVGFEEKERDGAIFVKLMQNLLLCFNGRHLSIFISYEKIDLKGS